MAVVIGVSSIVRGQSATLPATPGPSLEALPRDPAEFEGFSARLESELASLRPTTQAATSQATTQATTQADVDPEVQLAGWRLELWDALQKLRTRLSALADHNRVLNTLSRDSEIAKFTADLAAIKQKAADLATLSLPYIVTDSDVAEVKKLYEAQNQAVDALAATVQQQDAMLLSGFKTRRQELQPELDAARTQREQSDASLRVDLQAADEDVQRAIVATRHRSYQARAAAAEAALATLDAQEKRVQLENERNKLRLDALKPYVVALRQRMNSLIEQKSRSQAERIKLELESPQTSTARKAFLKLGLLKEETIARLQSEFANQLRDRFQETRLQRLRSKLESDDVYWKRFRDSLQRRSAGHVLSAYHASLDEYRAAMAQLTEIQGLLDQSISEQRLLEEQQRNTMDEFAAMEAGFRETIARDQDAEAIKLADEVSAIRSELSRAFEDMLKLEGEVIGRLTAGMQVADSQMSLWERARSRLYWSSLVTRGRSYFARSVYDTLRQELRSLGHRGLLEPLIAAWRSARHQVAEVDAPTWASAGAIALGVLAVGAWFETQCLRARRRTLASDEADGGESQPFLHRFALRTGRVGVAVVPILTLVGTVWAIINTVGLSGPPRSLLNSAMLLITVVTLAEAAVRILFHRGKARTRVVQCSATVARHYRVHLRAFIVLAVIFLVPANYLDAIANTFAARILLLEFFSLASTILAFLFLWRKESVLNVFPRGERTRLTKTVAGLRVIYPLLVLVTGGMIIMRLAGYQALASYIGYGLLGSLTTGLLAGFVHQLLREGLRLLARRAAALRPPDPNAPAPAAPAAAPAVAAESEPAPDPDAASAWERAILTLLRWFLIAASILIIGAVWGVQPFEVKAALDLVVWRSGDEAVTLWRIGVALAAVSLALTLSRVIRQGLQSQFYPRHPAIDRGAQAAINTLLHYSLVIIGLYAGLQAVRVDFTALAVLFGGLGLGLGLGLQPLIVNFISGLIMFFERHVKVGDVVVMDGQSGEVTQVSMRSTTIRTPDGVYLVFPNGEFINRKVENLTLHNQPLRGSLEIGVSYESDVEKVKALLLDVARNEPRVLRFPGPEVWFTNFGDNSLQFNLVCWYRGPGDRWFGMIDMRYAINQRFREAGIEIPFPQRTFNVVQPFRVELATPADPPSPPTAS